MKPKFLKTKIAMYVAFIVLTGLFAKLSFDICADNFVDRLRPQIVRAMGKVSEILPLMEENEQAVRDIYDNMEENSQSIGDHIAEEPLNTADGKAEGAEKSETNADELIEHTLSWLNRVTKLRVGREGQVIVVSKKDYSILAHPKEEFVGQTLHMAGASKADVTKIADLEELRDKITEEDIPVGFHIFYPSSIFSLSFEQILDALDAGMIGSVFSYRDTYILCGVTLSEGLADVVVRCFFSTLIFFVISWVIILYIGFALNWHKDEKEVFGRKLISCCALGTLILFLFNWYYQTIMDVTGDIDAVNGYAKMSADTMNAYDGYRKELSDWLDQQYLNKCLAAAEMVKAKGKESITRQDLAKYAGELGVEYIYVFDENGKVLVTNSPYDHFKISDNEEDSSYAFNALLEGRKYLIQDVRENEISGEKMQNIGVSIRSEDDLADGFVQIGVRADDRERILSPINVLMVLEDVVIGLPDYAVAIDKDSMKIVATTELGYEGTSIENLGLDAEDIKGRFNTECLIGGMTYYSGIGETAKLYLMPLVQSTDSSIAFAAALKMALLGVIAYLFLAFIAFFGYGKVPVVKESEGCEGAVASSEENEENKGEKEEKQGIISHWKAFFKGRENSDSNFERRWRNQSFVPVEAQTPEKRIGGVIYLLLLVFSSVFILFEIFLISTGIKSENLTGFSYVLMGNWDRGVNLFSLSYCLFLLCVLYVFRVLINQILYRIARMSDLQQETILLLIRNALRYTCAIIFLYLGLAKFGIDTRTLWASAGVLSLMVGFGAKDLVSDIIAGMFIIFDGTLKVGDFVAVGNWYGTVQKIGIRSTRIEYFSETKIFNNSSLRDIKNFWGKEAREVIKMPIPYEADLLEIEKLLEKELPLMTERIPGIKTPPYYQGIDSFEDSCILLRIAIYPDSWEKGKAARALYREMKLLFDREHISIPYNHVVVKNYDEKEGTYVFGDREDL
ncbi:MAG: mechanosensitive ion channel [Lachnospiraceae bacterium]|nr:mechanosensitive ion channel [Lachnospiraceae bacterium]